MKGIALFMKYEQKEQFKISIIIPVYNVKKYLSICLDSVIEQTYRELEIILIDDGSTDGSSEICDEYSKKDDRIIVRHQKNAGVSNARNNGLKIASGSLIAFVDSDDFIENDMYTKMCSEIQRSNAEIVICGHNTTSTSGENYSVFYRNCSLSNFEAIRILIEDKVIRNQLWSMLFQKNLFEGISFPENKIYEDVRTIFKLFLKAKKINIIQEALYNYRYIENSLSHTKSISSSLDFLEALDEQQKGVCSVYENLYGLCKLRKIEYCLRQIELTNQTNEVLKIETRKTFKKIAFIELLQVMKWSIVYKKGFDYIRLYKISFKVVNYMIFNKRIKLFGYFR